MSTALTPRRGSIHVGALSPPRFLEGGGTDYERTMLASAEYDTAPAASAARWEAVLNGARAAQHGVMRADVAAGRAWAPSPTLFHGWKPWVVGLAGVGIVGAFVATRWPAAPVAVKALPTSSVAPASEAATLPAVPVERPHAISRSLAETSSEVETSMAVPADESPRGSARRATSGSSAKASSAALAEPSELAAEVRAIETIQTLLAWGQAKQAADVMADYRLRFPHGELALEADLLDVDIALSGGERERAQELARTLLERPAASRYRSRLRGLLGAATKTHAVGSNGAAGQIKERR